MGWDGIPPPGGMAALGRQPILPGREAPVDLSEVEINSLGRVVSNPELQDYSASGLTAVGFFEPTRLGEPPLEHAAQLAC